MTDPIFLVSHDGDKSSKLGEWSSLIGIITAIVGNIFISFALNIQRYAHIRLDRDQQRERNGWRKRQERSYGTQQSEIAEERTQLNLNAPLHEGPHSEHGEPPKKADSQHEYDESSSLNSRRSSESTIRPFVKNEASVSGKTYLSSPYWWAGILLMTTGEAGNFLAYGFAPASIVSPLGVVALVSNCIIAPCLLKERFRQRDFWGVVIAVGGAVTVVLSAKSSETKISPQDIWAAITRWEFELYLGITAVMIIILILVSGKYGNKSILIDLGIVGLCGGYTALSTKGVASLLSDTLWRTLTFPITYLLVFVLIASALAQIRYLNRALQRFDSTQVIPTQFVLFTFSVIVGSAVLYRDFNSATPDRVGKFLGGCALTFLGVYLITSGRPRSNRLEDGELEDEEEAIGLVDEERYQDESGFVDGEDDDGRRKPRASNSFDRDQSSKKSRQSSGQHRNGHSPLPQTPQRLHSYSSSTKSNTSTKDGEEPESPLGNNPWRSPEDISDPTTRPTPKENTVSSPMLPSEAQRSGIPPTRSQSRRHLSPHKSDRPSTLSRKSMSRMLPGPLVSPLSSPLNAIVADSLRRGVDPRRRPGISSLRQSRSQRSTIDSGSGEMTFETSQLSNVHEAGGGGPGASSSLDKGRSQSMGATLADLFRIKKDRSQGMKSTETEENSGSSPSY